MRHWTWDMRDWRPWAFVVVTVGMAAADVLLPSEVLILPYLVIPLIASAVLARPGFCAALLVLVLTIALASTATHDYPVSDSARRLIVLTTAGLIAVVLAWLLRRDRDTLDEATAHFRLLAEHSSDVVYLVGPERTVTWISPSVTEALGYDPGQLVGRSLFELVHPEDQPRISEQREGILAGRSDAIEPGSMIARFRRSDGSYTWMSVRTTAFRSPDGALLRAVSGLQRVDDLVHERENYALAASILAGAFDAIADPIIVLDALPRNDDGAAGLTLVLANDAAFTALGVDAETPAGADLAAQLTPGSAAALRAIVDDVIGSKERITRDGVAIEAAADAVQRFFDVRAERIGTTRACITWRDVTQRMEAAEAMATSEESYRLLASNSTDVVLLAQAAVMQWVSPSLVAQLGWHPDEWVGHQFEEFTHPDDVDLAKVRREEINAGVTRVTRLRMRNASGDYHWVEVHGGPFYNADGEQVGIVASFRIVDDQVATLAELERRARYDSVTGALMRDVAMGHLERVTSHPPRSGSLVALLFCDLDRFKTVNDSLGHAAGDAVLRSVVAQLRSSVRSGDLVARLGGDEFLVILDGIQDESQVVDIAEKIRASARVPIPVPGGVANISLSIGAVMTREDEPVGELIERADQAMYRAKQAGRDQVVFVNATP